HVKAKPDIGSMLQTDMMNGVNQRRASTNQQYRQVLVEYQDLKRCRSSFVSVSPAITHHEDQHTMGTRAVNEKYLESQQKSNVEHHKKSCTNSLNNFNVRKSSISQNL
ncbi:unnamed protein product, partial [Rotaria socialis]